MKRILILLIVLFVCNCNIVHAIGEVDAESCILMEKDSKRVLYEKNKDKVMLTASICKIMTAIVALEWGDLEKECLVTNEVSRQTGSSIYLKTGDCVKLIDLIYGLLLRSGNDCAYLISINVGEGYEDFINKMNAKAKQIGMLNTSFKNPSGLDEDTKNYSTAYDMAILMSYCLNNNKFAVINSTKKYVATTKNNERLIFINKHKLLQSMDYVIGGKTGYTKEAHRTLITAGQKNDVVLIVVTFNCGNDWSIHQNLFDYGFNDFKKVVLFKRGILDLNYKYEIYVPEDVSYIINEEEQLTYIIVLLQNPSKEIIVGKIKILVNNVFAQEYDLYRYY